MCVLQAYLGDGEGHAELLASLQPKAPGGGAFESDAVVAAHGLLDEVGCVGC